MTLKLHNTLTGKLDEFKPISDEKVTLYTCGPTVYDYPHVGNWSSFLYWDILVRALLANGYGVERVMNITDVGHLVSDADDGEDKLEKGARREGKTAWEIAEFYAEDFVAGMEKLGLIPPEHLVKATDFIAEQLALVRTLKEKGYTYQTSDGIYFDTAKFPAYATFAHLDLAAQKAGARVEQNDEKRQPWDCCLQVWCVS
jgi:cysteinyl-tRNA synthetase